MTMLVKAMSGKGNVHPGPMDSGNSASRMQRNFAEKQRRDKLNSHISELANIVPMVSMSTKRLDKTSILRLSAAHLRFYQTPLASDSPKGTTQKSKSWRPKFLNVDHLKDLLEVVEGFVLVTSCSGKIIYISQSVEKFLGHQHIEMIGYSIFNFLHSADTQLVHECLQSLLKVKMRRKGDNLTSERCSFFCRIRERSQPRSEVITYQVIHVVGHLTGPANILKEGELISPSTQNEFLFKAFVRLVNTNPYKELSLVDAVRNEYVTRHKLDGTIIYADHRLSTLTGHLPHEVLGISAHKYLLQNDVPVALFAQKQMFASNNGKGVVVYRLKTRDESIVYLRSSGYLQYDQATMQVDHFVCINTLLGEEDGENEMKNFREKFSPHISSLSVKELSEFFTSVHTNTLRRIQKKIEFVDTGEPQDQNPLSLSNLVEPNLYLGSNCLVKIKNEPQDFHCEPFDDQDSPPPLQEPGDFFQNQDLMNGRSSHSPRDEFWDTNPHHRQENIAPQQNCYTATSHTRSASFVDLDRGAYGESQLRYCTESPNIRNAQRCAETLPGASANVSSLGDKDLNCFSELQNGLQMPLETGSHWNQPHCSSQCADSTTCPPNEGFIAPFINESQKPGWTCLVTCSSQKSAPIEECDLSQRNYGILHPPLQNLNQNENVVSSSESTMLPPSLCQKTFSPNDS